MFVSVSGYWYGNFWKLYSVGLEGKIPNGKDLEEDSHGLLENNVLELACRD
jgi:hypothetical protein